MKILLTFASYDFSDKVVGVIGGGSSAIQIVPQLQKLPGVKLKCFVRSKTWISQPFGAVTMEKLGIITAKCRSETFAGVLEFDLFSFQSPKRKKKNSQITKKLTTNFANALNKTVTRSISSPFVILKCNYKLGINSKSR